MKNLMQLITVYISFLLVPTTYEHSPIIEIPEESPPGTVLVENLQQRLHLQSSPLNPTVENSYAAIGNPSSPGISSLTIQFHQYDARFKLVVKAGYQGPDREQLCGSQTKNSNIFPLTPKCDITLVILYGDRLNPTYTKATLRILDVNDNAPKFSKGSLFEIRIPEGSTLPSTNSYASVNLDHMYPLSKQALSLFALPIAFDPDLNENGVNYYKLTTVSGHEQENSLFDLIDNATENVNNHVFHNANVNRQKAVIKFPTLRVTGQLDRETSSDYWFHLLAFDGGIPQRTGTLTIHVTVTDLNDNPPTFQTFTYHQPKFTMNKGTHQKVDKNMEGVRIPETTPIGAKLITLTALDKDVGLNSEIIYRLKEPSGVEEDPALNWFALLHTNQSVTLQVAQKLDVDKAGGISWNEANGVYIGRLITLVIEASDTGSPSLSSSLIFHILVENVNDNAPNISIQYANMGKLEYVHNIGPYGSVLENQSGPMTVAHLTVTDNDALSSSVNQPVTNMNAIRCELNDSRFNLEQLQTMSYPTAQRFDDSAFSHTGEQSLHFYRLSTLKPIDREQSEWVYIKVTCIDQTVDADPTYLSRETSFPIQRMSGLTGSTTVVLHVMDINDNEPKFLKNNYQFEVLEWAAVHNHPYQFLPVKIDSKRKIGKIVAYDADGGKNGKLTYTLLNNPYDAFKLASDTGELSMIGSLDREQVAYVDLQIEARDGGDTPLSSTTVVHVDILDVNDNAPYWLTSTNDINSLFDAENVHDGVFYFSVYENSKIGTSVGVIRALDKDGFVLADNGEFTSNEPTLHGSLDGINNNPFHRSDYVNQDLTYRLEQEGDARYFTINQRTGNLRLNQQLDRETKSQYELRVFAIDNSHHNSVSSAKSAIQMQGKLIQQHTATATIIVTVLDVNDNAPQFEKPIPGEEFTIVDLTPGQMIFTAEAKDLDAGENSSVRYVLANEGYGIVDIDWKSGICYVKEKLNYPDIATIFAHKNIPFSERILNKVPYESSTSQADSESKSTFSVSLTIIAHDMGNMRRLNNSRTVSLVWNADHESKVAHGYQKEHRLSRSSSFFGTRFTSVERLLIPFIIGAVLLCVIILIILASICRYRKHIKPNNVGRKDRSLNTVHYWCGCCSRDNEKSLNKIGNPAIRKTCTDSSLFHRQHPLLCPTSDAYQKRNPILDKQDQNGVTRIDHGLPGFERSFLPDCIPITDNNIQNSSINSYGDATLLANPSNVRYYRRTGRYDTNGLSRAFSDESLNYSQRLDQGYTALCAYPTLMPDQRGFIPLPDDNIINSSYIGRKYPTVMMSRFQHSPPSGQTFDRENSSNIRSTQQSKFSAAKFSTQEFYNPIDVSINTVSQPKSYMNTTTSVSYNFDQSDAKQNYEEFAMEQEAVDSSRSNKPIGSGWKPKLSDTYAENTFV